METKILTEDQILAKYEKLSAPKKVTILYGALSYMQSYNGRSYDDCIIYAMCDEYQLNKEGWE